MIILSDRLNKTEIAALQLDLDKDVNWQKIFEVTLELTKKNKFKKREVVLSFVTEKEIKQLNKEYRGKNSVTDVLSFPMDDHEMALSPEDKAFAKNSKNPMPLGDLVICSRRAIQQAKEYGHSQKREFVFLYVHGLLHLLGYDHIKENDAKKMFALQDKILSKVKINR